MTIEIQKSPEFREPQPTSKIELNFFRHSIKEKDPSKKDEEVSLTPEGRMLAKSKASSETNIAQAVAFGSPRERTQETAGFIMAGSRDEITGDESLEELRQKLDAGLGKGSKLGVSTLLDFTLDESSNFGKVLFQSFLEGRYLAFTVQESDQRAKELHDEANDTYSRMASRVASLVKKYVGIAPRFNTLVSSSERVTSDTLHRFFGTHQGVAESFLAKVIEKMEGVDERDRFVAALGNQGFDFTEGFRLDVQTFANGTNKLHLSFKKERESGESFIFDEDVPMGVIDEICAEGTL